jgi:hypothetical protein
LTVFGTGFVAASVVNFAGAARPTTFVSATQVTAAIPGAAIATAGTAPVTVTNPGPEGVSKAVNFSITLQPMDPMEGQYALSVTVDSLGPECATLPDEARHRMYVANIIARSDGNFVVSLGGGRFLSDPICAGVGLSGLGCNQFTASRAADTVRFSLQGNEEADGGTIVEQIPQIGWTQLSGSLTSPVNNDMMSARGEGNLWFCPGTASYPFPCSNFYGCAVHDLRMTFVRQ